ncbi:MAG: HAD family hydrolase [Pseudomonadales bacterium]|jgi:Cof subfamily protein (haloacid dehalogenase superfamily)|nr:HAD family hydrolase [Pseudomonadales bacterium]
MELIVFDLDGTLLDASSRISPFTRETLARLAARGIHYTVATGRALHASRDLIAGHGFDLPQAYKNGVLLWRPELARYSHHNFLTLSEIRHIVEAVQAAGVTPFLSTLEPGLVHRIYHLDLQHDRDRTLAEHFRSREGVEVLHAAQLPADAEITSISALGPQAAIASIERLVMDEPDLVAYAGTALEGAELCWIDIHHHSGSKGNAVDLLREELGAERVLVFGDGDNDLSMFATADEAYAPSNARAQVKAAATAVIGHHAEDGIARFLRERFDL